MKSEACKKKRLIYSSFVLLQEITGAKLDQDKMDCGEKITLDKMIQFIDTMQLKPRFQLKPLENLLKEGFFEEEAIEKANQFIAFLKSKAEETSEKTSTRKEKLVQKEQLTKSQLTLHQLFTLPFIIPHTVPLSSIQPEAETLCFSTHAVIRNLQKISPQREHKQRQRCQAIWE